MAGRLLLVFPVLAGLGACGGEADLRLAAASSLSQVLPPLLAEFERDQGVQVEVVFGGSGELVAQLRHGAPFDALFLAGLTPAAEAEVEGGRLEVGDAALLGNFVVLAAGAGVLAPGGSPAREIREWWGDLAGSRVAIGGEGVPAGAYARDWMAREGLEAERVGLVPLEHVRAVLAAIESGACAAGFVYFSDAFGRQGLELLGADLEPGVACRASYPYLVRPGLEAARRSRAEALLVHLKNRMEPFQRAGFSPGGFVPTQAGRDALCLPR